MVAFVPMATTELRRPRSSMPARQAGSARRTTHVDVGPGGREGRGPAGETSPVTDDRVTTVVRGGGHEVETDVGGAAVVLDARSLVAGFDTGRCLRTLNVEPEAPWAPRMLAERSGGGFRRALAERTPPGAEHSLVHQLLDDLPAALLISGYSSVRLARLKGLDPARLVPPEVLPKMTDLCSGWRSGGVAVESIALGRGVPLQDCPPSTDLEAGDPVGWHVMATLPQHWMRRRRCIDVVTVPGGAQVWAMFRDTVAEHDGAEVVLHEYSVSLSIEMSDEATPLVAAIEAEPAVLPFPECPAAAAAVRSVVGSPLSELPRTVPDLLVGVASCTHLNDLLRSIGGAAPALMRPPPGP